jgi:hypothetical protein
MKSARNVVLVMVTALICGCETQPRAGSSVEAEGDQIVVAVLTDLVTRADETGATVRFVELAGSELEHLRKLCGHRYTIEPSSDSNPIGERLYLGNTSREGVWLTASVGPVHGRNAFAVGGYSWPTGTASFEFKLRKQNGFWRIRTFKTRAVS